MDVLAQTDLNSSGFETSSERTAESFAVNSSSESSERRTPDKVEIMNMRFVHLASRLAIGLAVAVALGMVSAVAHAAVGDVLSTVSLPAGAQCSGDSGAAIAIIPGGKLGFPKFPTLLVTSCQNKLFLLEPSTSPATLIKTITTTVTPSFGWEALTLRPDRGDILGCGIVSGQPALYSIDFLPSPNAVTDGTAVLVRNGPAGSTCEGIGWDQSDNTIYESSTLSASPTGSNPKLVLHVPETGADLAPVPSGCNSLTGVAVTGTSLFVTCEGGSTINQLNKADGVAVTSFNAGSSRPGDIECDPVTFVLPQTWHPGIQNKDVIWVKSQQSAEVFAVEAPFGACGPVPPPPALCPDGEADTDGDSLFDCWEDSKWWSDGNPGIALDGVWALNRAPTDANRLTLCVGVNGNAPPFNAGECASRLHKDIFLEIDYMQFHQPNSDAVNDVVQAFANAPVMNPDTLTGVRLHVQVNDQIPHFDRIALVPCTGPAGTGDADFDTLTATWFGTATDRANPIRLNARRWTYHHAIWAHNQTPIPPSTGTNTSSGCAELPGNEFIVTMGSWSPPPTALSGHTGGVGSRSEQAGTFLHELGHNLNLRHGGGDRRLREQILTQVNPAPYVDLNCKPNHVSVMNYAYQMPNTVSDRPLDFSRQELMTLNEGNLDESLGVGLGVFNFRNIAFGQPVGFPTKPTVRAAGGPISWDLDTNAGELLIKRDLNWMTGAGGACPSKTVADVLEGFDEWANIQFNFRASTDFAGGVGLTFEPVKDGGNLEITREEHLEIARDRCDIKSNDTNNTVSSKSGPTFQVTYFSRLDGATVVDARNLDRTSLTLSGFDGTWSLNVKLDSKRVPACSLKDVDHDGRLDLVCQFDAPRGTGITPGVFVCNGTIPQAVDPNFPNGYDFVGSNIVRQP